MMRARHGWAALAIPLAAAGCGDTPPAPFEVWAERPLAITPTRDSGNAFDRLAIAALEAERSVSTNLLDRTSFTPGMKATIVRSTRPAIDMAAVAVARQVEFRSAPRPPFEPAPYHRGWRAINRALAWRIEQACGEGRLDDAVSDAILAHKLGFALTGGSVADATLGLATVDEARAAIGPHLNKLGAGQLRTLSIGVSKALDHRPSAETTLANESKNMRMAVQAVQDAYQKDDYEALRAHLGPEIKEAIRYLQEMKQDDAKQRPGYFQGFADEAVERVRWVGRLAAQPAIERKNIEGPNLAQTRPWRRFAKHFFTAPEPYLTMLDATLARSRLLSLRAAILADVKSKRAAPKTLGSFPTALTTDPYSGRAFVYRSSGPDFTLYSVGADFRDNGGETDESFSTPDLTLER